MKQIEIGVGSLARALADFADTWGRAEKGERLAEAVPRVNFESLSDLLAVLTPDRLAVLETVAAQPRLSIRALAARLSRDYGNVHEDVIALSEVGLIERDAEGQLAAPYDELVIRAPLKRG